MAGAACSGVAPRRANDRETASSKGVLFFMSIPGTSVEYEFVCNGRVISWQRIAVPQQPLRRDSQGLHVSQDVHDHFLVDLAQRRHVVVGVSIEHRVQ